MAPQEGTMTRTILGLLTAAAALAPAAADAQVLGTFTWQMQPYCNRVSLTLTTTPGGFVLHGVDDRCGATVRGSASGAAVFNADGSVSLNFSIASVPAGTIAHVSAGVSPATGQGTWSDDLGHSGTFVFGGSIAGLPLRPSSPAVLSVADNPQGPDDPCAVPAPRPTLVLCGTAAGHWRNGGNGLAGLQVWRGRDGQVHIRGSVHRSAGSIALPVFVLPAGFVPRQTLALAVSTGLYGGSTSEEPPC